MIVAKRMHQISEYFFSEKMKEIFYLEKKGIKIINLGIGNPDLLPPNEVIHKMKKASELYNANTYQSYTGIEGLRKAISCWYEKTYKVYNIDHKEEVLPLMGSKEGIMHISLSYLEKGDQVLIPNPGYPTYSSISRFLESEIIYYDLHERENWCPNIQLLENKDLSKVKIMWINYPHMPTGATITFEKLEEIVFFAKKNRILLVHDNPYSFILNDQRPLSIFNIKEAKDIALELNSLSKSYNMAGWRVGMIIGKKEFIKNILKVKSQMDSGMYYPIQIGAIEAMNKNSEWFKKLNIEYCKRKKIIWKICDRLNLEYQRKSSGIFIWAKLPNLDKNDRQWSDKIFKKYYIFITPGSIFGENGKGYVRLSMCCPIKILEKAKNRICS